MCAPPSSNVLADRFAHLPQFRQVAVLDACKALGITKVHLATPKQLVALRAMLDAAAEMKP